MKPTSDDLRKRVVAARHEDGQSMGEIAERFRMPKATVQNILRRYGESGSVVPKPRNPGRKQSFSDADQRRLEAAVEASPDCTLAELRDHCGVAVSVVTVHNTLKRLGFTRKKKRYIRASNAGPT